MKLLATHATEICGHIQISSPAVSQHLKVLLEANVVTMERQAKQRIYRLNPVAISKVEEWTRNYRLMWSRKFEKLDILLQERMKKLNPKPENTIIYLNYLKR
ncbi:ArsR/SmtB family transcription factor [Paenibacillus sp. Soil724D2]|uniref:ArsR/SmtB family transcription factor n=1 Tax=Paenibacillus sp. (strain Soil724D2) TaxID=1736392 RepID=UPI002286A278|nr:ArsR family transcriptional regulator [Paenibacillus sp. Soil724D2]